MKAKLFLAKPARAFDRGCEIVDTGVRASLVFFMGLVFVLLMLQVVMRYVVQMPLAWVSELTSYVLAYLVLWGSSSYLRNGRHVHVDTLVKLLPSTVQKTLALAINVLVIYFCYLLITAGHQLALLGTGDLSPSGTFNLYWPRLAIVTGGVVIALQALNNILQVVAGNSRPALEESGELPVS